MKTSHKIVIIGNLAGGKTWLARQLNQTLGLSVFHVDSIQFLPEMKIRSHAESIRVLEEIHSRDRWIIDGYGPLDILEKTLTIADLIIFIDLPLWRHYWWCTKRQIRNIWSPRQELPAGCNELTWSHTKKLYKTIWQIHTKMRPEMLRILARENLAPKVLYIRTLAELTYNANLKS